MTNELWVKDDQSFDLLLKISKTHVKLAKEHASQGTSYERRQIIIKDINRLRLERDTILNELKN